MIDQTNLATTFVENAPGNFAWMAEAGAAINQLTNPTTGAATKEDLAFLVKSYGPIGVGADSAAVQAAIDTAASRGGGNVHFSNVSATSTPTVYDLLTRVDLKSNVKLTQDPGVVISFANVAPTGSAKVGIRAQGALGSAVALTANAVKGAYTVTVASAVGLAAGDWVRLSSTAEYAYDTGFKRGEIKRIRDISGTTLTFEQALYDNYPTSATAVLAKITPVTGVEVRGLTFRGSNTPSAAERALNIEFCDDFTVHHNRFVDVDQYCVYVRSSIRGRVDKNNFRGVYYDGTTGTIFYAILISSASQWVQIKGNYGERVRHLYTNSAATNDPGAPRHILVDGNTAQNMMAGGAGRSWAFEHHGVGEDIMISNNLADGCYGGFVTRGPGVSFKDNHVRNWWAYALHIHPDIRDARDIVIDGNVVEDRTSEGGGPAQPAAAIRGELALATTVRNVVIKDNVLTYDIPGQPSILIDSVGAGEIVVVKDNVIDHAGATVNSISCPGSTRTGNVVNGVVDG
jgi:hypothetical protein